MIQNFFDVTLAQAMGSISPFSYLIVFLGGVLTSISPCILTMIPVIVGYIGGYTEGHENSKTRGFRLSLAFVLGLSVTFAVFGVVAVMLGRIVGQVGDIWYYVLSVVAIVMGLHLLGVINIRFPSLGTMPVKKGGLFSSFLIGLMFGLVASPCATPVLAVIVAYVATSGNIYFGASLLFVYGLGHGLPLIIAGTFTAVIKQLPRFQKYSRYFTLASGLILVIFGLYFLASARWN